MIRAVVLVVMLASAERAFAQGNCLFVCFSKEQVAASYALAAVAEGGLVASSIVTALGSSVYRRPGWYAASYALAFVNLVMTAPTVMQSISLVGNRHWLRSPPEEIAVWVGAAVIHSSLFVWNLVAPSVALNSSGQPPVVPVVPVAIGGRGPTGKRWAGVALQVATF
jgi:hypothetical protein